MITYQPNNNDAQNLLNRALATVDGRLAISEDELRHVAATLLAQSHKTIHLPAHKKATDALLGEVIGRDSGRARFFVKPAYRDPEAQWRTKDEEETFRFHPRTKGNAWVRTSEAAKTLLWEEISGIGFSPAYYIAPVDLAATVAAFKVGAMPSVSFTTCDYPEEDLEGAVAFSKAVSEAAFRQAIPLAQIGDGWVCADPTQALMHFHICTTRFFGRHVRFAFITRDKWGRQETAWGSYK